MGGTASDLPAGPMADPGVLHQDYQRVREAIHFLAAHRQHQPSLSELAAHLHLSDYHLQRVFTRWAGVSPKRFLQFLTKQHAKRLLREPAAPSIQEAAWSVGLSGSSRLHDLMLVCESVTPGEYQRLGEGLRIQWGEHPSPFGSCLLAVAPRGVCFLAFFDTPDEGFQARQDLQAEWGEASLQHDPQATAPWMQRIFGQLRAEPQVPLAMLLKGSPFQLKVWEALLRLPVASACTYGELATALGRPTATRAVASAVARNKLGYLIPCHRVIRSTGEVHAYRWGATRKQALLAWESAWRDHDSAEAAISTGA